MKLHDFARNKTIHDNFIIQVDKRYYCTNCKTWYYKTKKDLKKYHIDDDIKYRCQCGAKSVLKYGDKHEYLHSMCHIVEVQDDYDELSVNYHRVDKYWESPDWELKAIVHPVVIDIYKHNNTIRYTNDIAKTMGWTDKYYIRSYDEKWRKATKSQHYIDFERIYIASERTHSTKLQYFNLKRYSKIAAGGYWLDRLIQKYDYEYELLQKQNNMQLIMTDYDKHIYKQYKDIISRYKLNRNEMEILPYSRDIKNVRYFASYNHLDSMLKHHDLTRLRKYLSKREYQENIYNDYCTMALDYYGTLKGYKYPNNLKHAHDDLLLKRDFANNEKYDEDIKRVAAVGISYKNELYIIEPFDSSREIVNEGNKLNHCVAIYIPKYAKQETQLYKVRKLSDPGKPFITVEIKDNDIKQVYGKNNTNPPEDVKLFLNTVKRKLIHKTP